MYEETTPPDIFVDELPLGATGKVVKVKLRETYADVLWDAGA